MSLQKAYEAGKKFIQDVTNPLTYQLERTIVDDDVIAVAQSYAQQLNLESLSAIEEVTKRFIDGAKEQEMVRRMIIVQSAEIEARRRRGEKPVPRPPLGKFLKLDD